MLVVGAPEERFPVDLDQETLLDCTTSFHTTCEGTVYVALSGILGRASGSTMVRDKGNIFFLDIGKFSGESKGFCSVGVHCIPITNGEHIEVLIFAAVQICF